MLMHLLSIVVDDILSYLVDKKAELDSMSMSHLKCFVLMWKHLQPVYIWTFFSEEMQSLNIAL